MPAFLTIEQVTLLRTTHRSTKDKRLADKIKAILSLNAGYSYEDIAHILLLDEVTLRRHIHQFQSQGIEGLLECRYTGGIASLTEQQQSELKKFLKKNTQRTAKEIVDHIQTVYRISYSVVGVTKLLHRLGFTYKKPKIVPGKANLTQQKKFLVAYTKLKASMNPGDQLYFVDATHPQHTTDPQYGWILKGKKEDKFIKTSSGRSRLNLNGALNLHDHSAVVHHEDTINADAVIRLAEALIEKHPTGMIYLILDNARYHHAKKVKEWRKHHTRIKLVFLPPYSPNLNLIERLWRFFHQRALWNRYFETFEEFKTTSLDFFKNLNLYEAELNTLLTDNFRVMSA
jgi:transposase